MSAAGQVGLVRRLAYPVEPGAGESFTSWIDRIATDHFLKRTVALRSVGLLGSEARFPRWFGIDLDADERANLSAATGVTDFDRLLLGQSRAVTFTPADRERYSTAARWSAAQWVRPVASWLCPQCLAEDGYWRRDWHLPWVPICLRHRCYLTGTCSECGGVICRLTSDILDLRICQAGTEDTSPVRGREPRLRRRGSVCGADLTSMATPPVTDRKLVGLCQQIQAALDGRPEGDLAGFADLRSLVILALQMGNVDMVGGADARVRDTFETHTDQRDTQMRRRGSDRGGFYRSYRQTPTDPQLMAAALRATAPLCRIGSERQALADFVDAAGATRDRWTHLRKFWKAPDRFAPHLDEVLLRRRRGSGWYHDGRSAHKLVSGHPDLSAQDIPQLLWPEATAWICAQVPQLVSGWSRTAPRVLAAMLARQCQPQLSSWSAAFEALRMPAEGESQLYRRLAAMHTAGTLDTAYACLTVLADRLAQRTDRIDYGARRRALAHFDIDAGTWSRLLTSACLTPARHTDAWRARAAAWIWCLLVGGSYHFAPSLGLAEMTSAKRQVATNAYSIYFCTNALPRLEPVLRSHARQVLREHGLDGPLEMSWTARELSL